MKTSITALAISAVLLMAAPAFSQDFDGEAVSPPGDEECDIAQTEMVCDLEGDCKPMTVCYDSAPETYPDEDDAADGGGSIILGENCGSIGVGAGSMEIYIGAIYNRVGKWWINTGGFGYCINGTFHDCDTVTNPLEVRGASESDWGGTTDVIRTCTQLRAIGPWM